MLVSISVRYLLAPFVDGFYIGLHKYSMSLYDACIDSFHALPVAALVDHKFFCVNGGISPQLVTLKDLERVRVITPPSFFSLLWFATSRADVRFLYSLYRWIGSGNQARTACCVIYFGQTRYQISGMNREASLPARLSYRTQREGAPFTTREWFLLLGWSLNETNWGE